MQKVVMFFGPPGSGKGTQANLLAAQFGLVHFDTGRYLEQTLHNPHMQNNAEVARERAVFDSGALVDPAFVLKITTHRARQIADGGFGLVFSGSPRTVFEAFGDRKHPGLIETLRKKYGRQNMRFVYLKIKPEESIQRNKKRKVCSVCGLGVLAINGFPRVTQCPLCGGKLKRRTVDNPKVFHTRIDEYNRRTKPILDLLKKKGYSLISVNGHPLPHQVFREVITKLHLS